MPGGRMVLNNRERHFPPTQARFPVAPCRRFQGAQEVYQVFGVAF